LYRYSVGAEVMRTSDLSGLFQFASVININLAVVNILPLPALDGVGRWHVDSP
jgi:membrane-associated protease RseP (regulator of RpoE activity)